MMRWLAGAGLLTPLVACDDAIFGGGEVEVGGTYCGVTTIVEQKCAGCHTEGGASGGLALDDLRGSTVNKPSSQDPDIDLVEPGDRNASWLYLKAVGQHGDKGTEMPPGEGLDEAYAEAMGSWIDNGATASCLDGATDDTGDGGDDTAVPEASWCDVDAMIDAECTICHFNGAEEDVYVSMGGDAYSKLVMQPSGQWPETKILVVPGYPEASLFWRKITHELDGDGGAMPPAPEEGTVQDTKLDQETLDLVTAWIEAGAAFEEECP